MNTSCCLAKKKSTARPHHQQQCQAAISRKQIQVDLEMVEINPLSRDLASSCWTRCRFWAGVVTPSPMSRCQRAEQNKLMEFVGREPRLLRLWNRFPTTSCRMPHDEGEVFSRRKEFHTGWACLLVPNVHFRVVLS